MNKYLIGLVILGLVGSIFVVGCTSATPSSQTVNAAAKSASATTTATRTANAMTNANAMQETQLTVTQGQPFTLWLRSNPSTGYQWQVHYDSNYVTLISQTFISDPHPPGKVGVGGYDLCIFTTLKEGTTAIRFDNISPAQQVVNTTTCTVVITV
jgi:inhibitor of cysteine peptidase